MCSGSQSLTLSSKGPSECKGRVCFVKSRDKIPFLSNFKFKSRPKAQNTGCNLLCIPNTTALRTCWHMTLSSVLLGWRVELILLSAQHYIAVQDAEVILVDTTCQFLCAELVQTHSDSEPVYGPATLNINDLWPVEGPQPNSSHESFKESNTKRRESVRGASPAGHRDRTPIFVFLLFF